MQVNDIKKLSQHNEFDYKCTRDYLERCHVLSEQVHSQHFSVCESISMEVVPLDHFNKLKPYNIPMAKFCYRLSDESDKDSSTTTTNTFILIPFLLKKHYSSILDNHFRSQGWLCKSSIPFNQLFIYYHVLLYNFLLLFTYNQYYMDMEKM